MSFDNLAEKFIYIASPFTAKKGTKEERKAIEKIRLRKTDHLVAKLHDKYPEFAFFGPITQSAHIAKYMESNTTSFSPWAARDLKVISVSDEVWVLQMNGWKESVGVQAEIEFAYARGIPVKYISFDKDNEIVDIQEVVNV